MKRLQVYEGLRGLAAIWGVLFYIFTTMYNKIYGHQNNLKIYFKNGHYGVEIFLILSGFGTYISMKKRIE